MREVFFNTCAKRTFKIKRKGFGVLSPSTQLFLTHKKENTYPITQESKVTLQHNPITKMML